MANVTVHRVYADQLRYRRYFLLIREDTKNFYGQERRWPSYYGLFLPAIRSKPGRQQAFP